VARPTQPCTGLTAPERAYRDTHSKRGAGTTVSGYADNAGWGIFVLRSASFKPCSTFDQRAQSPGTSRDNVHVALTRGSQMAAFISARILTGRRGDAVVMES